MWEEDSVTNDIYPRAHMSHDTALPDRHSVSEKFSCPQAKKRTSYTKITLKK